MSKKKVVSFDLNQLPTCCGFFESGDFRHEEADDWSGCENVHADSYHEAWTKAIAKMRERAKEGYHTGTRPIIFNFVKRKGTLWYEANILRKLVKAEPDVKFIGKWVNANTGNTIEAYVLTNGAE
jgi:hypothetical protein